MGVNLALIGSGYWGSKVKEVLSANSEVDKLQIIDIKNGDSIDQVDQDITAAIIATPLWDHYNTAYTLLSRGLDCYIEKPMAETVDQCIELGKFCPERIIMVGHIFIYHPALDRIKECIHKIGKVRHAKSERLNWGIYQTKTSPLLSLLPHDISIMQELFGNMTVTHAEQQEFTGNHQPDHVRFTTIMGDITGEIVGSWFWPERVRKLTIIGEHGHIVWDDAAGTVTLHMGALFNGRLTPLITTLLEYDTSVSPLELELTHFVKSISTRTTPRTGVPQASQVAEVINQVQRKLLT
jgi:predicted dehydrogenase